MYKMSVHKYHSKKYNPSCNIMMLHNDFKNTIIVEQGDHNLNTEYLWHTQSPWRNIKMFFFVHADYTMYFINQKWG